MLKKTVIYLLLVQGAIRLHPFRDWDNSPTCIDLDLLRQLDAPNG